MQYYHTKDWVRVNKDTEYSKEYDLYWHKGRSYCPLSASHNGIVGVGAKFKDLLNEKK